MPTIAVVTDLIFSTKITATAKAQGKSVSIARTLQRLAELLAASPDTPKVIIDLNASGLDPLEAIRVAKSHNAHVTAYLSHVQVDLATAARDAGADEILPRSAFVNRLLTLLA